jgi:hypothetical protein
VFWANVKVPCSRSPPFDFTLTARAENYLYSRTDLKDTTRRLQAYQQAGVDVLCAPGFASKEDIAEAIDVVQVDVRQHRRCHRCSFIHSFMRFSPAQTPAGILVPISA